MAHLRCVMEESVSALRFASSHIEPKATNMIESIESRGIFFPSCSVAGETRAETIIPAHIGGMQLRADRFLILYATRGFNGTDDDRSIIAQVRADGYDGSILSEKKIGQWIGEHTPATLGRKFIRQCGHPTVFGVPIGAVHQGKLISHAGVFVAMWRCTMRPVEQGGYVGEELTDSRLVQCVHWVHFRLSDAGDQIELLEEPRELVQKGFEKSQAFCALNVRCMNQTFCQPQRMNPQGTQWIEYNHFEQVHIAALCFEFNEKTMRYEWTKTGPLLSSENTGGIFEASITRWKSDWVITARTQKGNALAWARVHDPFVESPALVFPKDRTNNAPITSYICADGVLRTFGGDPGNSLYGHGRNPLYLWEINPDRGFASSRQQMIFDCCTAGIGLKKEDMPRADFCKLLPHAGGCEQFLGFRVRVKATNDPNKMGKAITSEQIAVSGLYYAKVRYDAAYEPAWNF